MSPHDGDCMWHPQVYIDAVKSPKRDAASIVGRGLFESICQEDLGDTVGRIGALIADNVAAPCLTGDVVPNGCTVRAGEVDVPFEIVPALPRCAGFPTGLAVAVDRSVTRGAVTVTCPGR